MLEDGTYDGIVVDAEAEGGSVRLDVTILTGAHKGEMVAVRSVGLAADPLDLLATPCTLTVSEGEPRIALDL
jgi:hypothetical protein